jgi:tRNA pseudouridine55 synthase
LLLGSAKAYAVEARLGQTTDTEDADGAVLCERPVPNLDDRRIDQALAALTGRILQRPPAYSALKRDGVPAYRRARAGETFELAPREVEVHAIRLLRRERDRLWLQVECGSGTYVRSLVRDLGEALGCGAHVAALRRLWVTPFERPQMHTLEALAAVDDSGRLALLLPLEAGLRQLPSIRLADADATRLRQGQRVPISGHQPGAYILWQGQAAVGRGRLDQAGLLHPERLFNRPDGG